MDSFISGKFLEECKGRFIGKVLIDGCVEECYISSTSRLEKYIDLINKQVLLERTIGRNLRTKYKLFAAKCEDHYIFLNLNESSEMLKRYLIARGEKPEDISRECRCDNGLKTDLRIGPDHFIEVKAVISDKKETEFPGEYSRRFERQLELYMQLLSGGKSVELAIMLFNEHIQRISINKECRNIYDKLREAISAGMCVKVYKTSLREGTVHIEEDHNIKEMVIGQMSIDARR